MNKPLVTNAVNEEQIREAEGKGKDIRKQELEDISYVMKSIQGRRFLWKLLGRCNHTQDTYRPNNSDQSFENGKRNVGLFLFAEICQADPDAYLQMMKESKEGKL